MFVYMFVKYSRHWFICAYMWHDSGVWSIMSLAATFESVTWTYMYIHVYSYVWWYDSHIYNIHIYDSMIRIMSRVATFESVTWTYIYIYAYLYIWWYDSHVYVHVWWYETDTSAMWLEATFESVTWTCTCIYMYIHIFDYMMHVYVIFMYIILWFTYIYVCMIIWIRHLSHVPYMHIWISDMNIYTHTYEHMSICIYTYLYTYIYDIYMYIFMWLIPLFKYMKRVMSRTNKSCHYMNEVC